jgi:NADH dehydrogenase FAD-containing subunit
VKLGRKGRQVMSMAGAVQLQERSKDGAPKQEAVQTVVIVGAGLAGLATALALHRYAAQSSSRNQLSCHYREGHLPF